MDAPRLALLVGAAGLALAAGACGDDERSVCGAALACSDLAGEPGWAAGTMDAVPEGFPAAPAGAELCGQADGPTVYWLVEETAGIHEHYRAALTEIGWTPAGPVSAIDSPDAGGVTCATEQVFTMGDPLVLLHVFPSRGAFSLSLPNLEN